MEMMKRVNARSRVNQHGLQREIFELFGCVAGAGRMPCAVGRRGLVDEMLISCISIDDGRTVGSA